jgi:SagB-type dehydrogenase family enzyme
MLDATDTRSLALLFHLNSLPSATAELDRHEHVAPFDSMLTGEYLSLPEATPAEGLLGLIGRRRSCRAFAAQPMALSVLSEILAGTYGLTGVVALGEGLEVDVRAVPSAGALYPLELYVLTRDVEDLDNGLYRYAGAIHALEVVAAVEPSALDGVIFASPFLENANAIVLFAAVFDRTLHKYGARGYRYVLLEAGHAAQNFCLLAEERNVATLCAGGFVDTAVNRFLGLSPSVGGVVYCVGLGHERR